LLRKIKKGKIKKGTPRKIKKGGKKGDTQTLLDALLPIPYNPAFLPLVYGE